MRGLLRWPRALWLFGAPVVFAQSGPADAGPKLNAIYQAEWEWWKDEMAEEPDDERPGEESDHLPRVSMRPVSTRGWRICRRCLRM